MNAICGNVGRLRARNFLARDGLPHEPWPTCCGYFENLDVDMFAQERLGNDISPMHPVRPAVIGTADFDDVILQAIECGDPVSRSRCTVVRRAATPSPTCAPPTAAPRVYEMPSRSTEFNVVVDYVHHADRRRLAPTSCSRCKTMSPERNSAAHLVDAAARQSTRVVPNTTSRRPTSRLILELGRQA